MDAYSQIVTTVAAHLIPRVAALTVEAPGPRGHTPGGGGSGGVGAPGGRAAAAPAQPAASPPPPRAAGAGRGVAFTGDGVVLTKAHVVARGTGGRAAFADGS